MGKKKYVVKLTQKQQKKLLNLTRKGEANARQLTRARVLLLAAENRKKGCKTDEQIRDILDVSLVTIHRIRRQFVEEGLIATLNEKPRSGRPKHFTGRQITALACSTPPEGHAKWSMRLIADKAVELEYFDTISYQTVHNILKKNALSPHLKKQWCIGKLTTNFRWRMEDILNLYELPYDALYPLICFDERPCQLIDDVLQPLPMAEGKPMREDYHYKRNGVGTVFMAFEPKTGRRFVEVRERRRKITPSFSNRLPDTILWQSRLLSAKIIFLLLRPNFRNGCRSNKTISTPIPRRLSTKHSSHRKRLNCLNGLRCLVRFTKAFRVGVKRTNRCITVSRRRRCPHSQKCFLVEYG